MSAILGYNPQTKEQLKIGDVERRSGLYILGKSGMGKSSLIVNLMLQDVNNHHGIFFLDPHGDAIVDFYKRIYSDYILLDIENEEYTFGINPLTCSDIHSLKQRVDTYTRTYNVFHKLWEEEWGAWMQLIIQHALYVFIENPEYTIAEIPLFLLNPKFREHMLSKVTYATDSVDFWEYQYQPRQAEAALNRITMFLGHPYIKHIVGQRATTINFNEIMDSGKILLLKLSSNLAPDIRKFTGALIISELIHAIRNRPEGKRRHFSVYIDEFQNFITDDFVVLFTEARKFGIAVTIAHQERYGQFGENLRILGATAASANKAFFQLTARDAQEFAPEFAHEPPTETRMERELVISQEPIWDMLKYGHANPYMQELVDKYLKPRQERIRKLNEELENINIVKQRLHEATASYQNLQALENIREREMKYEATGMHYSSAPRTYDNFDRQRSIINDILNTHKFSLEQIQLIEKYTKELTWHHDCIRQMEDCISRLMQGKMLTLTLTEQEKFIVNFAHFVFMKTTRDERDRAIKEIETGDAKKPIREGKSMIVAITEAMIFCRFFLDPDNHVKVPSGQYTAHSVYTRTIQDMTNEMEQELISLPRFMAYAKIIKKQGKEEKTEKRQIKTLMLIPVEFYNEGRKRNLRIGLDGNLEDFQGFSPMNLAYIDGYCRERIAIMEEIRKRQARWRTREQSSTQFQSVNPEKPPPTQT